MLLPALFIVIAILYAAVGFGGGSSYIALLVLFDLPFELIAPLALTCNIIVVVGGTYHFMRRGHFAWRLFWPFAAGSLPMAFIGGRLPVSRAAFLLLLGVTLLLAGLRLLALHRKSAFDATRPLKTVWGVAAGAVLGLMAGVVGIGGGIFLAPLMLNLRWAKPKQVAAVCSLFILVNSLSGLTGQLIKHHGSVGWSTYWPLFVAVLVGGQLGSRLGAGRISQHWVRTLTAILVIFVGARVLLRWWLEYVGLA